MTKTYFSLEKIPKDQEIALTIGNFDGVHRGHTHLIEALLKKGAEKKGKTAVLTFQNHPKDVIEKRGTPSSRLFPLHQKELLLKEFGVDYLFIIPFTTEIQSLSPEQFLSFLQTFFNLKILLLGEDAAFGKDKKGTKELILSLSKNLGIEAFYLPPLCEEGAPISSSRLKKALWDKDFPLLFSLLGRPYSLSLFLEKGSSLGKKLTVPTFNFSLHGLFLPPYGVYEVFIEKDGVKFRGIANLGVAPTLKNLEEPLLEVHVLTKPLPSLDYKEPYTVSFVKFIREEKTFLSPSLLKDQILKDIQSL